METNVLISKLACGIGSLVRFRVLPVVLIGLTSLFSGATPSSPKSETRQSGYQQFFVGDKQVIALSDGTVPVKASWLLHSHEPNKVADLLRQEHLTDPVEVSINAYLIKLADKLVLLDTGAGELFGPEHGGKLLANLQAAGYSPEQITDILITHIHLDHSGGLTAINRRLFPNATVHVNQKELDFWLTHQTPKKNEARGIKDNRTAFLTLKPYLDAGQVRSFAGDTSLFKEVRAVEYAGHTPGHTVFVLESQNEKLVFWGDLIHVAAVQLHAPEMANEFDFDKERAGAQRQRAYQQAAEEGYLVAADHIAFPGIGRIKKEASSYRWRPLPYTLLGRTQ